MKKHIIGTLFALVLLASVARASETVERTDLADIFQGFDGTFIMYDEGADRYTIFNKALSETRLPPCSTFKVFHALIGLDSGVLDRDDARTLMKWNGKPSSIAAWNHDQTLASAMRHSVVWYFQRVATGIGEERMQRGLDRIGYGNRDISGGLTRFWLQSSLKISASCAPSSTAPCPSPPRTSPSSSGTSRCPPGRACASWARQAQARTTPTGAS